MRQLQLFHMLLLLLCRRLHRMQLLRHQRRPLPRHRGICFQQLSCRAWLGQGRQRARQLTRLLLPLMLLLLLLLLRLLLSLTPLLHHRKLRRLLHRSLHLLS